MRLAELVETSRRVAATGGRLEKITRLAALLRRAAPAEFDAVIAFLSGAPRQGRIGIGYAAVQAAMPGAAVATPTLTVAEVDETFARIAAARGPGSAAVKGRALHELLARAAREEQEFLARLVLGELRQGALEAVMVEAVAEASGVAPDQVRRALMAVGDLRDVARVALSEGEAGLARYAVQLFRPVQPMLAQTADDPAEAVERLGRAALEWKLDGARVQIHKAGDEVKVYSRRLREVTPAVPELVEAVRALPARELIADGEAIALRPDGTPHPFQVTMRRLGRKLDVDRLRSELPLTTFLFDLLYLDGAPMLDEPQAARFRALVGLGSPELVVPHRETADADDAAAFLAAARERGHEGIMAKAPDAPYAAGRRGAAWLKVKPAHTLDLVVLGAEWGHGRRRGWLSNLHLGARDPDGGGFVMVGKTFKGMTDEILAWQTERLLALEIGRDRWTVYVRPELVVEVAFNDAQASPQYPGGVALRFARVRRYRTDKAAAQADTIALLREMRDRATS